MLTFTYRAKSQNGTELRGVVQAVDRYDAAQKIRMNAPMIIELKQVKEKGDSIFTRDIGSNRINTKNLSVLCDQIAITLRSGIPLARCLQMIGSQCEDKILKKMMIATAEDVSAGSSVASSMERNCEQLPATLIETIRAGEQSGNIEHSFEVMSKYYEKTYKNQDKIKSAMSYPIFVICVAVVVLIVVMTMVVPALTQTFRDLGGELPLCTRVADNGCDNGRYGYCNEILFCNAKRQDHTGQDAAQDAGIRQDQCTERIRRICQYTEHASEIRTYAQ